MRTLSDAVRKLIAEHIDSLEKLEALVSILRSRRGGSAPKASGAYPLVADFEATVASLVAGGILGIDADGYRIDDRHRDAVEELLLAYETERSSVLSHLSRQAISRIRRSIPAALSRARGGGRGDDE